MPTTGSTELVSLLVENGALVTATDHHGATPLHLACQKGHQKTVVRSEIFVRNKIFVN